MSYSPGVRRLGQKKPSRTDRLINWFDQKTSKWPKWVTYPLAALIVTTVLVTVVLALSLLPGLVFMIGWNNGIVALVHSLGGYATKISFWTAVFTVFTVGAIVGVAKREGASFNFTKNNAG